MKAITCTAWDLISDPIIHDKIDNTHEVRIKGGKVAYHFAAPTKNCTYNVRLERMESESGLKINRRYVSGGTIVELIPIPETA